MSIREYTIEREVTFKGKDGKEHTKTERRTYLKASREYEAKQAEIYTKMGLVKEYVNLPNGRRGYIWSKRSDVPRGSEAGKRLIDNLVGGD